MADMQWREAIIKILEDAGTSLSYTDIAEAIVSQGLTGEKVGATPANTVGSVLSQSLAKEGSGTPFVRVGKGEYALKSIIDSGGRSELGEPPDPSEELTGGVNAFGMYWSKDLVYWPNPKLLGQQQIGANIVDLSEQIGVYLLHDAQGVVYVGRSTDRPITQRLLEHTRDRLQARWNRFSWFGLFPVTEKGELQKNTPPLDNTEFIRTLEAVLIEAMEPRQNRRRGDVFASNEYIQEKDSELEKQNKKSILQELIDKV